MKTKSEIEEALAKVSIIIAGDTLDEGGDLASQYALAVLHTLHWVIGQNAWRCARIDEFLKLADKS